MGTPSSVNAGAMMTAEMINEAVTGTARPRMRIETAA